MASVCAYEVCWHCVILFLIIHAALRVPGTDIIVDMSCLGTNGCLRVRILVYIRTSEVNKYHAR